MNVIYTRHANGRMRWRKITREEIEEVLQTPERREQMSPGRYHYFRRVGTRYLRVTCIQEKENTYVVISVVDKSD